MSNFRSQKSVFDIYTQPFITRTVKERFEIMCQVGEYTFEITIDVVNMVERRTTQFENEKELRFSKNIGWSQFAYLKLRKTRSGFSIPLDFEIAKVACISFIVLITEKQLTHLVKDLFFAGSETVSKSLLWALVYLVNYPHLQEQIFQEIKREVGQDRLPGWKDRTKIPSVDAFMYECLR